MSRFLVPLGFILLVILLGVGLTLDPREVPSPLIGKPAPQFSLPTLAYPDQSFSPSDMKGKVWMLNVWATWCNACRAEHDTLLQLRETNAVVVGLNYKDDSETAARLLQQLGDPYLLNAVDIDGRAAIDWGVYGAPETFIIDKQGIIRHKHIGPLTPQILHQDILPLLTQLNGEQG